jgi:hypothetical protein
MFRINKNHVNPVNPVKKFPPQAAKFIKAASPSKLWPEDLGNNLFTIDNLSAF